MFEGRSTDRAGRSALRAVVVGLLAFGALLVPAVAAPSALASVCQNCEDPPPPPPVPPQPEYRVTVNRITGWLNNDNSIQFYDEVYLQFYNQTVWGPNSVGDKEQESGYDQNTNAEGATRYPNVSTTFVGNIWIQIWDYDNTSADDFLGSVNMFANGSWTGVTSKIQLYGSGAHYELEVTVRRVS